MVADPATEAGAPASLSTVDPVQDAVLDADVWFVQKAHELDLARGIHERNFAAWDDSDRSALDAFQHRPC